MKAVYYILAICVALLLSMGITGFFVACCCITVKDITLVGWLATTLVSLILVCVGIMIVHDATKPVKEEGVHHTI